MILPGTYLNSLILLALSLLFLGSWANSFKATANKWRFELYYFDFAVGAFLVGLVAALTVGSLGAEGFSFADDMRIAGQRSAAFALAAAGLFNLGSMLIVAGMSVTAMAVAVPVGMCSALVTTVLLQLLIARQTSVALVISGSMTLLLAIGVIGFAWHSFDAQHKKKLRQEGKTPSGRRGLTFGGITLSLVGGIFQAVAQLLLGLTGNGTLRLGPYSLCFILTLGIFISTAGFNLFFMKVPIVGRPVTLMMYIEGKLRQHLAGLVGGALFAGGLLANLVVMRADGPAYVKPGVGLPVTQISIILPITWGLFKWNEMSGTSASMKKYMAVAVVLVVAGVGLITWSLPAGAR